MKYPRTPHLPFSPGGTKDDRRLTDITNFINTEIVITEKLDGGNCLIHKGEVYARSTTEPTNHPTFNWIKNKHAHKTLGINNLLFYGENMYGIHSIEYDRLEDYFYLFHVYDYKNMFLAWDDLVAIAANYEFSHVPIRWRGILKHPTELHLKLTKLMEEGSALGGTCEGFVVRPTRSFGYSAGVLGLTAKYVRANHVQSDEHWQKNWRKAKLWNHI